MAYPKPVRYLTYPGDVSHIVGEIKGPTLTDEVVTAVTADYNSGTDKTRVGFAYGAYDREGNRLDA